MAGDWDVRTNLNSSPGSQGTLFSGGKSQMSDARYPRGYTPERLRAVADHVIDPQVKHYTDGRGTVKVTGVDSVHARSFVTKQGVEVDKSPVRNIVDTIARSTVPVEHLQNVQFSAYHGLTRPGSQTLESANIRDGAAGTYHSPKNNPNANADGRALIRVAPKFTQDGTVIHEIGHHVSSQVEHTGHSVMTAHPAGSGAEEAFADNYEQTHFRDRRGRQAVRGTYGGGQFAGHIDRPEEFWKSYHSRRDNSLSRAEMDAQNEEYLRQYPEERQHPDGSFDVPMWNKSYVTPEDRKRGVKAELEPNYDL